MEGSGPPRHVVELLACARQGDRAAVDRLLELYRPYLRLAIRGRMPGFLQKRVDGSDIVQQTLIDAQRGLTDFRGDAEGEITAWMMKLLERNLLQSIRRNTAEMRDVRREAEERVGSGSARLIWHTIAGDGAAPQSCVFQGEAALLLAEALEQLPPEQRAAVELRYLAHRSLESIAGEMGKTTSAVAGLIRRGVAALQAFLPAELGELS